MVQLEWVFLLQVAMGIIMIIFLQKINRVQKQIDGIVKEVQAYVDFVTEDDAVSDISVEASVKLADAERKSIRNVAQKEKEEEQNHLIQSVLGEYFP